MPEAQALYAGQSVGAVRSLGPASEIVTELVDSAEAVLSGTRDASHPRRTADRRSPWRAALSVVLRGDEEPQAGENGEHLRSRTATLLAALYDLSITYYEHRVAFDGSWRWSTSPRRPQRRASSAASSNASTLQRGSGD